MQGCPLEHQRDTGSRWSVVAASFCHQGSQLECRFKVCRCARQPQEADVIGYGPCLTRRIGRIRPPFKSRTLCARDKSHQSLVQTATYPTEFEPKTPQIPPQPPPRRTCPYSWPSMAAALSCHCISCWRRSTSSLESVQDLERSGRQDHGAKSHSLVAVRTRPGRGRRWGRQD